MANKPDTHEAQPVLSDQESRQTVVFKLGSESFGIDIFRVHEIIRLKEITPIPRTASHIRGLVNLRGNTIPVIDLRSRLAMTGSEESESMRIIVVESDHGNIGIVVDEVSEVITLEADQIEPMPQLIVDDANGFVEAVARRGENLVTLLNLDQTLVA